MFNYKVALRKTYKFIPFLILILISLTPLLWFKANLIIAGGDHSLYLNPSVLVERFGYSWSDVLNLGESNFAICHLFPYGFFWYLFQKVSLSSILIEKMWFIFTWFLGSFSIYKLTIYITKSFKYSSVAGIFAALLYQFNTYKMLVVIDPSKLLAYAALPLLLYLFIKGLDNKKSLYAIYFAFSTLLFVSSWVNPPQAVVVFIPPFMYFFYYLLINRNNSARLRESFLFVGKSLFLVLLINLWWIIPFYLSVSESVQNIRVSVSAFQPGGSELFEVFRLMGSWAFRSLHYYPYNPVYYNTPIAVLTYLIPLFALFSLFQLQELNKKFFYFYLLLVTGIFLVAGSNSPLGFLFSFLYKHFPAFWIFRVPYAKFTPLNTLSISVLFGVMAIFFFQFIDRRLISVPRKKFYKIISGIILIGIILICAFPLLTGDCIWHYRSDSMRSFHVKIPGYWNKISSWLKNNSPYSRIFITPRGGYGQAYNWKSGISVGSEGIAMYFISNPYCTYWHPPITNSQRLINNIYDNMLGLEDNLARLFKILSIKFILQQNDLDWKSASKDTYSTKKMREILNSQKGIFLRRSFVKLDLYEVSDEYLLPHIYSSITPIIVDNDIEMLTSLAGTEYFNRKSALFFSKQEENQNIENKISMPKLVYRDNEWKLLEQSKQSVNNKKPEIIFKKINPTKYLIEIEEAKNPFWLVFSESFHKQWRIYKSPVTPKDKPTGQASHQSPVFDKVVADYPKLKVKEARYLMRFTPEDIKYLFKKPLGAQHHLVNGYANGWYINPKKMGLGENFVLVIYFWPQTLFYLGLGISGVTLLGCVGYLGYSFFRRKSNSNKHELHTGIHE